MANSTVGFGLEPVGYVDGTPYTGACNKYYHDSGDSTALFKGDPVVLAGSASTDGYPTVIRATVGTAVTTDYITGVVVGFQPLATREPLNYGAASTGYYVLVADDPKLLFRIKSDGTTVATDVGSSCQIIAGSGNTYTGLSGFKLDESEVANTATDQLIIVGIPNDPSNSIGADGDYLVRINMHTSRLGSAGI